MPIKVLLTLLLLCLGCSKQPPGDSREEGTGSTAAGNLDDAAVETGPDLTVPRFSPKPVVWIDQWTAPEEISSEREEAQELASLADQLKAFEQFSKAEEVYQKAMAVDPTWAYPAYQLACNYELWGKHAQAVQMFQKAVESGLDDFPVALTDNELGQIRERPDFEDTLVTIRERYIASSPSRIGQPIAVRPDGESPPEGWPMLLLLHGYGDTNLNYLDIAEQWADLGFVTVAVPGSVPSGSERYQWAMDSIEPTHQDVQAIVHSPLFADMVNQEKVFLLGFSQGALHGLLLTAEHPDDYTGVVALSPGGSMAERIVNPTLNPSQSARIVFIHGTEEPHAPLAEIWKEKCRTLGWQFMSKTHDGGHHFPQNWDSMMPAIAKFLVD